tara:strand:+ start:3528 stop:4388 length:861 start_codon:yes stop_codon:yes gene_type:complete
MISLDGKITIVTGAGRGLGRAMAKGLLNANAKLVLVEVDQTVLDDTMGEIGQDCLGILADVSKKSESERIVSETIQHFGNVHCLINNAGLGPERFRDTARTNVQMVWEIEAEDWKQYLGVNMTAHFFMTKAIVPHLLQQGWGRIVNVTTSLETMIDHTNGAYGPSKAGAEALATMTAVGLEGTGVTCNVLIPGGPSDTRMISSTGVYEDRKKLIKPEVMVAPLLTILSDNSDNINNVRVRAVFWDKNADIATNLKRSSAPIAWPQLGGQAIQPPGVSPRTLQAKND